VAHDTQFSPEEVEELKRLFKEHTPPDGLITYKGRKVRLKPPEAKTVTVKEVSVTRKPQSSIFDVSTPDPPSFTLDFQKNQLKTLREKAAKRALAPSLPPLDSNLLLHVRPLGDEEPSSEKEKEDKET